MSESETVTSITEDEILAVLEDDVFGEPGTQMRAFTDVNNNYGCSPN